ncbi:conjugative transposon protein TraM [Sphingobacterium sp. 1.A.4]|uniref:conjugative transposon protein TraM n=1 Tax=Sphingobacterium sp. 1.A.4 TaxID=2044603 RepID=UPI000C0BCA7C|nr:conjugative transposon protein TraM [Sphingobacterium sp. 1.A.4]
MKIIDQLKSRLKGSSKGTFLAISLAIVVIGMFILGTFGDRSGRTVQKDGLIGEVPSPNPDGDLVVSKLEHYERLSRELLNENLSNGVQTDTPSWGDSLEEQWAFHEPGSYGRDRPITSAQEQIYDRLEQIGRLIKDPEPMVPQDDYAKLTYMAGSSMPTSPQDASIKQLEGIMADYTRSDGQDEELQQLGVLLDKIQMIQDPSRIPMDDAMEGIARRPAVHSVFRHDPGISHLTLDTPDRKGEKGAFQNIELEGIETTGDNSFRAMVEMDQLVQHGSILRLRLLDDLTTAGLRFEKQSLLFGECSISQGRLRVRISSLHKGGKILPVNLEAHDLDGMLGLYVPGTLLSEPGANALQQQVNNIAISDLENPGVGRWYSKVAGIGVDAARKVFSKRPGNRKIRIRAGHQLLLVDSESENIK